MRDMKDIYILHNKIKEIFNISEWQYLALKLYNIESRFCYKDFEKSAKLTRDELKKSGAKDVELIEIPADGETVIGDFIMPMAWDFEEGYLIIEKPEELKGKILAYTKKHPFHIANRCAPSDNKIFNVVHINDLERNRNFEDTLVFCKELPPSEYRNTIEKKGCCGIISSYSGAPDRKEDVYWINGWVKNSGWYHTKEDKNMICFSVTPSVGELLEYLLKKGEVKVSVNVKSKIYPGKIYSITGKIPGRTKKEILLLAHLYEPIVSDNATGVAGLIEISKIINEFINNYGFIPEIGIRFLFSMERYGMAQFFNRNNNIIYGINIDSIADDIFKTEQMKVTLFGSPFTNPFFGDWLFEILLEKLFPLPWKKKRPEFLDDTFISDAGIGVPSLYFTASPGKFHHNSYLSEIISWKQGMEILCLIATYICILSSKELRNKYIPLIRFSAIKEFYSYFERLSIKMKESPNFFFQKDVEERIYYIADYIKRKYSSLSLFDMSPEKKLFNEIDKIAEITHKDISKICFKENKEMSREDKKAENIVIKWRKPVFIFSLADIPHKERIPPPIEFYAVINRIDGKKTLYQIYKEISWEREFFDLSQLSEQNKKELTQYILYLSKYGYVKIDYKTILTKEDIKEGLRELGIKRGDKIVVHSSLSALGYVIGGAKSVCEAIMEYIGEEGLVIMPSFNHGTIFTTPNSYFSPIETPTTNGAIPDTFWRMKGVYRSLDPTHSFAVWGKNAKEFVRNHHKFLTMGKGSPLYLLEQVDGKIILIDALSANTFHHVVEMTNNVPCLGKRTEEYNVKLPSGKIVKIRTWGWRNGVCEITDKGAYLNYMRKKKLLKEGKIGNAKVLVIEMKKCREVIEKFLKGKIKGYKGCKSCLIRPRIIANTTESDWDEKNEKPKSQTTAFTGDYEPICYFEIHCAKNL